MRKSGSISSSTVSTPQRPRRAVTCASCRLGCAVAVRAQRGPVGAGGAEVREADADRAQAPEELRGAARRHQARQHP
eukprot:4587587-Pyramimonas_sp.AAC.2